MFNLAKGIVKSARNQNQQVNTGSSGSKNSIQPPHVSNELLETQRNREVADADILKDPYLKELNQWYWRAPSREKEHREMAADRIFSVYEGRQQELDLFNLELTSLPRLGKLDHLIELDIGGNNLCKVFKNTKIVKVFFEDLAKLSRLDYLGFACNDFVKLFENQNNAKVFFEGLSKLEKITVLRLPDNNISEFLKKPEMSKLFFKSLGDINNLQLLALNHNKLDELLKNTTMAELFFKDLNMLTHLTKLDLRRNNLGELLRKPKAATVFFEGLSRLNNLKIIDLSDNNLGETLENQEIATIFVKFLGKSSQLQKIYLVNDWDESDDEGESYEDLVERIRKNIQQNTPSKEQNIEIEHEIIVKPTQQTTEAECDIVVKPIHDGIETKCIELLGQSYEWTNEINKVLLDESKTVADAIFACQLLVYMGPSNDPHRPKQLDKEAVQNKINAVCLNVLKELADVDSNNPDVLKARDQEIADLSSLVQYCHHKKYLSEHAASTFNLLMGNIQGLNKAFNAIQELQNNQQIIVQGIQSLGDIVNEHTQRIDSLHKQCQDCFEYVMKRMSDEYRHLQKDLRSTQEHLKKTLDSLHEIGQKRLMAARIKAVSGTALSAVALIPFVGACIAEGSRAIANAFSIAGALNIFDRIEILKQSIADAARDSTIEDLSDEIRKLTLGKLLTNHGIALPSNNETIQDLAAVTLGEIFEKVSSGISAVADHRISDLDDSATEQNGTAFGEIRAAMSNHSFPNNAQTAPAILPTQQRAAAGQVTRPQAIAPAPEPAPLQRNDSAGSLDSTGSLATVDEAEDELAAAIKLFDTSDPDAVESFNRRLQKAIKAEQVQSGSTSLTTKTLPTRNSNKLRATAMDFTAHYGRPQLLKIMDAATFATIDDPKPVELQSTQKKVYDRALTDAKYHEGNYRGGKRIAPSDDQAS